MWLELLQQDPLNEEELEEILEHVTEGVIEEILESGELTEERTQQVVAAVSKKRACDASDATFSRLCAHCTLHEAKTRSLSYREGRPQDSSLIYGEIPLPSLQSCFSAIRESEQESLPAGPSALSGLFVDLGCGSGKVVLGAALERSFRRVVGIELMPELHSMAMNLRAHWLEDESAGAAGLSASPQMDLLCADFLSEESIQLWTKADVVLAHCTCFSVDLLNAMAAAASAMRPDAFFITTTFPLAQPDGNENYGFEHVAHVKAEMPYHIHRRSS